MLRTVIADQFRELDRQLMGFSPGYQPLCLNGGTTLSSIKMQKHQARRLLRQGRLTAQPPSEDHQGGPRPDCRDPVLGR